MSSRDDKQQETSQSPTTATSESKREVASSLDKDRVVLSLEQIDRIKELARDRQQTALSKFLSSVSCSINDILYYKEKLVSYYARLGDGKTVQWLIRHFQADMSLALYGAARGRQAELVQDLVPEECDRKQFFWNAIKARVRGEIDIDVVEYLREIWNISFRDGVVFAALIGDYKLQQDLIKGYVKINNGEDFLSTMIQRCSDKLRINALIDRYPWFRYEAILSAIGRNDGSFAAKLLNDGVFSDKLDMQPSYTSVLVREVVEALIQKLQGTHSYFILDELKLVRELFSGLKRSVSRILFSEFFAKINTESYYDRFKCPISTNVIFANAGYESAIKTVTKMSFDHLTIWLRPGMEDFFSRSASKSLENNGVGKEVLYSDAQRLAPSLSRVDFDFLWEHALFEQLRDELVKLLSHLGSTELEIDKIPKIWDAAGRYAIIWNRQDLIIALEKDLVSFASDAPSKAIITKYLQQLREATALNAGGSDKQEQKQYTGPVGPLPGTAGTKNVSIPTTHSTLHASSNTGTGCSVSTSTTTVSPPEPSPPMSVDEIIAEWHGR